MARLAFVSCLLALIVGGDEQGDYVGTQRRPMLDYLIRQKLAHFVVPTTSFSRGTEGVAQELRILSSPPF